MVIFRVLHLARRIDYAFKFLALQVMIIGLSLIQVGADSIGGGYAAMTDNTAGAPERGICCWRGRKS